MFQPVSEQRYLKVQCLIRGLAVRRRRARKVHSHIPILGRLDSVAGLQSCELSGVVGYVGHKCLPVRTKPRGTLRRFDPSAATTSIPSRFPERQIWEAVQPQFRSKWLISLVSAEGLEPSTP